MMVHHHDMECHVKSLDGIFKVKQGFKKSSKIIFVLSGFVLFIRVLLN